ncbi:unnamed protein product [Pedinophyceae sp. YPF-701]|nr:unnamed protein product [Pedinophyceae sp. YPF-701]
MRGWRGRPGCTLSNRAPGTRLSPSVCGTSAALRSTHSLRIAARLNCRSASVRVSAARPVKCGAGRSVRSMPRTNQRLRLLCLHSFQTDAWILDSQLRLAGWTSDAGDGIGDLAELVTMDAPHVNAGGGGDDVAERLSAVLAARADRDGVELARHPDRHSPRQWWDARAAVQAAKAGGGKSVIEYDGFDASLEAVRRFVASRGPFHGVLGFSQGSIMAAAILAAQHRDRHTPLLLPPSLGIIISGFAPRDKSVWLGRDDGTLPYPTVHVIGLADKVVPPAASRSLTQCFTDPLVVEVEGVGHRVPRLEGPHLDAVRAALVRAQDAAAAHLQTPERSAM